MLIRKVKPSDYQLLSQLGIQTYYDHYTHIRSRENLGKYVDSQFNLPKLKKELEENGNIQYYFFLENHLAVGFIKLKMANATPLAPHDIGLELEKIYFLKEYTGKGYGSLFIDFVFDLARENKSDLVWLDVLKINEAGIRLYEKMGFEIVGEIPFATDIMDIGFYLMKKLL